MTTQAIRLENFPVLEKVAPNPTFITPLPDRSGEYAVSVGSIARAAVAFKYQVHLDESSVALHAPIVLTPAWKIEATQASVILSYSLNPAFVSGGGGGNAVRLQNLTILVNLDGGKATTCQSKPVGTFSKERSLIYWRLGDVTLEAGRPATKVLARFSTESEAKPGSVDARWEIGGEHALGAGSGLEISCSSSSVHPPFPPHSTSTSDVDPFADESVGGAGMAWKPVTTVRKLISGKYTAM